MPDVWVFPGGALDPADAEAADLELPEASLLERDERAHQICGARELAEEAAIELPDPAALKPWARWITPVQVTIRFDTRFYVGLAPSHSKPEADGQEIVEVDWFSPKDALDRHSNDELGLVFPTVRQLESLSRFGDSNAVMEAAFTEPCAPILPRMVGEGENQRVLLDPDGSLVDDHGRVAP